MLSQVSQPPQAAALPGLAQWGYSQPQGGYRRAFVLQMNIDIKVLPLLMSIDVLFFVFTVMCCFLYSQFLVIGKYIQGDFFPPSLRSLVRNSPAFKK